MVGGASWVLVAARWVGWEVSESSSEAEWTGSCVSLGMSSSSSSSSASSSLSEAEASSAISEGRPRLPEGADLRRGAAVVFVDFEAGRGGLKEGILRLVAAGLEVVGGMAEGVGQIWLYSTVEGGIACSVNTIDCQLVCAMEWTRV